MPLLAVHFAAMFTREGRPVPVLRPETNEALVHYDWPGNVRELENAMERAVVLSKDGVIGPQDLPAHVGQSDAERDGTYLKVPLGTSMREIENLVIDQALQISGGAKQKATIMPGISARTITRYLQACE